MSPGNYVASLPEVPQGGQVVGWGGGRPLLHRLLFLSSGRLQEVSCLVAFLVGRKLTRLSNQCTAVAALVILEQSSTET